MNLDPPKLVMSVDRRELAAAVRLVAAYDHAPLLIPVPESRQLIIMGRDGYGRTVQAEPVQCPAGEYDGGCATAACGRCLLAALADLDDTVIVEIEDEGPAFVRAPSGTRRWVPETACHH